MLHLLIRTGNRTSSHLRHHKTTTPLFRSITTSGHPPPVNPEPQDIYEVNEEDFVKKVISQSRNTAVMVDVWAPWCNPCLQLGDFNLFPPLLSRV